MLAESFFSIDRKLKNEEGNVFIDITMNPNHEIYNGHFPGMPICPGVCNIQTIRECAELELDRRLTINSISQCRFSALIVPTENAQLRLNLNITKKNESDNEWNVICNITSIDEEISFVEYKGSYISE